MLTEEQYGRGLADRLRQETADLRAAPDLVATLRRRQVRRTRTIRTGVAASVAAAAAVAVVVATTGQGAVEPNEAAPPAGSSGVPPVRNLAYVQQQTLTALNQATRYVIFARSTYDGGGHYEDWFDKSTQRYRVDLYGQGVTVAGGPKVRPTTPSQPLPPVHLRQSNAVSGPDGNQTVVTVDYDVRQWWTSHLTDAPPRTGPDITDPDSIRAAIAAGTVELVGQENVDGHDTQHLRFFGPRREYRVDMWVDGATYLPVRGTSAKAGPHGDFPPEATVTTHYSWLPRTEENLAEVTLTPPPGFQQMR